MVVINITTVQAQIGPNNMSVRWNSGLSSQQKSKDMSSRHQELSVISQVSIVEGLFKWGSNIVLEL